MKSIVFVILSLILLSVNQFVSAYNQDNAERYNLNISDSKFYLTYKPRIRNYVYHGFNGDVIFFTENTDTLNFFCEIKERRQRADRDNSIIPISLDINYDYSFEWYEDSVNSRIVAGNHLQNSSHTNVCYEEQLKLLDRTMDYVKTINDSIEITGLMLDTPYLGDAINEISYEYAKSRGKIHPGKILNRSRLIKDINNISGRHGLRVGRTLVYEDKFYLIDNDKGIPSCNPDPKKKNPEKILLFLVQIEILKDN